MVQLTLNNQNRAAEHRTVVIDIANGTCTLNELTLTLKQFMQSVEFEHPLIQRPYTPTQATVFHYEYPDIDSLYQVPISIYTTLLQAENPANCQFKISPSPQFQAIPFKKDIYFSINHRKAAKEQIRIRQLEAIVHHLHDNLFTFSEDLLIDESLTLKDLPQQVDGDALFETDPILLELLTSPSDLFRCELRYINPTVGFGVFCKEDLKEGEAIVIYTGIKKIHIDDRTYTFDNKFDCLNLCTDARPCGNLSRFINHAPDDTDPIFLSSNLIAKNYFNHGIRLIVYTTTRDIAKGEQLLISYGSNFSGDPYGVRFTKHNKVVYTDKENRHSKQLKFAQLKAMAMHGVHAAQLFLVMRWVSIIVFLVVLEQSMFLVERLVS
ncbi:MAG: SET domain-containing protein [Gammaproteobacteria bacterium]|nr:SET domain-containing protein [Gammaproteobacteria bacterium]